MAFEFKTFGLKDPYTDLKADPNFIPSFRQHDTHIEFRKCIEKRQGLNIKKLLIKEKFGESTKEWLMDYDSVNTEKRLTRYNKPISDRFQARLDEIHEWHKIMERRSDFVNIQADQGEVINEIIDGIMFQYSKDLILEKRRLK